MSPKELYEFSEKIWFEKRGLGALLLFVTFTLLTALIGSIGLWMTITSIAVVNAIVIAGWFWSRRLPKSPKDKIGFLIAISSDSDLEAKKLQEDFIRPLHQLIKSGKSGQTFHVMNVPEYICGHINDAEAAQALRIKCRAHFMIYGRVRLRDLSGKATHVLELEGVVAHKEIPHAISRNIASEFSELMPRRLHLSQDNDFLGFQFTSEWAEAAARYIIGFASLVSGDFDYAEELLTDLKDKLHGRDTKFPIYQKLKERIPLRLAEVHLGRADWAYRQWSKTKMPSLIDMADQNLSQISSNFRDSPNVLNLLAIVAFVKHEDAKLALQYQKKIRGEGVQVWHLNMAFLLGYQGNLKNAIRHYRLAANLEADVDVIAQVEDFIVWSMTGNPEKNCQLYYCLAYFNWKIKGDFVSARMDFKKFLEIAKPTDFCKEQDLARAWALELETSST